MVTCLKDLTNVVDMKTSSRPAMIGSLTDGSTETFWESGDEDKNKTKSITINCVKGINAAYACVHIDNSRDIGVRKCTSTFDVTFKVDNVPLRISWLEISHVFFFFLFFFPSDQCAVLAIQLYCSLWMFCVCWSE